MSFAYFETVRSGNSTATIKNFYANGLVVLININGEFKAGDTIVGDDSGYSLKLANFSKDRQYDIYYDPDFWDQLMETAITQDDGAWIFLDAHFTGKESQDEQPTYAVTVDT